MVNENGTAGRDVAKNRRYGLAPELAFGLGTDTRLKLSYYKQQQYDTVDFGIPWLNGSPAPVDRKTFYGYPNHDHYRANIDIGTVRLEHDFNDSITVASQTRYGSYRRDLRVTEPLITGYATGNNIVPSRIPVANILVSRHVIGLSSQETLLQHEDDVTLRFRTGPLEHTVVTGIEVGRQTSDPTRYNITSLQTNLLYPNTSNTFYPLASPISSISGLTANSYAAYVTDTVKIGRHIEVIGGWRFDRYDSTFHQIIAPKANVTRNDDAPTWRAALVYKPVDNVSLYASYGTSFNPSAEALALTASTAAVAPEKSRNYEVGGKWDTLNSRLSLTTAFYDLAKTNVRETNPADPTTSILAGNYRVLGFEVGATGHITDALSVFAGYSYNDAEVVSSPNPLELNHQPPNAPRHTFSTFAEYKLPWYGIEVGAGINWVSSRTSSSTPVTGTSIIQRAPGYVIGQLMVKAPITDTLTAQVNITNITDRYYYDGLHPGHIIVGPARAALFTLTAKL
jgi:catecholate siderophore receptor